jgi:ribose 5-phosphate isomerase A
MTVEAQKQAAAEASMRFVQDEKIVGLGSGSTAAYAVRLLAERMQAGLKIRGIPTSNETHELAAKLGIPLVTLDEFQSIDVTIDGADEIDSQLQLIKGGGAAFLREKIVASASRQLVIIADSTKLVPVLGKAPVPVEVIPFAQALVAVEIAALRSAFAGTLPANPGSPMKATTFWIATLTRSPIRPPLPARWKKFPAWSSTDSSSTWRMWCSSAKTPG